MNNHRVLAFTEARSIFLDAKRNNYALPAVNVVSSSAINAVLEAASAVRAPVIVQLSHGGAHFYTGRSRSNDRHQASITGAVAAARHVHEISQLYDVPVLINTDHAAAKLLPWIDGMLTEGKKYFDQHHRPLFTSHMLDLSEESLKENIEVSKRYLDKLTKLDMYLEIELGVTGGEEDGVDNSDVESSRLYTQPEEVVYAYEELMKVSDHFVIAASFGNVHGVYKPGNVRLQPDILKFSQELVTKKFNTESNPINFVFHGGSGSEPEQIAEAIRYGVIKMNLDTDVQWAYWDGVREYYASNEAYLQSQLGNRDNDSAPNKKYYDPRSWLRNAEVSVVKRLQIAFEQLNNVNRQP